MGKRFRKWLYLTPTTKLANNTHTHTYGALPGSSGEASARQLTLFIASILTWPPTAGSGKRYTWPRGPHCSTVQHVDHGHSFGATQHWVKLTHFELSSCALKAGKGAFFSIFNPSHLIAAKAVTNYFRRPITAQKTNSEIAFHFINQLVNQHPTATGRKWKSSASFFFFIICQLKRHGTSCTPTWSGRFISFQPLFLPSSNVNTRRSGRRLFTSVDSGHVVGFLFATLSSVGQNYYTRNGLLRWWRWHIWWTASSEREAERKIFPSIKCQPAIDRCLLCDG